MNTFFQQDTKTLEKARIFFNSLATFREERARCVRYTFGDQLLDQIPNPKCKGTFISEREYMKQQGITPLEMNIIRKNVKTLLGIFRQNNSEPLAVARDRDEQKIGEMMTIALQYAYQANYIHEKDTRGYEEFLLSSMVCYRTGYDYNFERQMSDITVDLCDINRMFWDNNTSGLYFENISMIGYLHDLTLGQILEQFAKTKKQKNEIINIYKQQQQLYSQNQQFQWEDINTDFFIPKNRNHCRLIEVWEKGIYDTLLCHDKLKGEEFIIETDKEHEIIEENLRRTEQMQQTTGEIDQNTLIDYKYKVTEIWTVKYITPDGYILHAQKTPFLHGSHPFTIGAYPLVDGKVHSFVQDIINAQRMVNRLITRIEFSKMNAAKGFSIVNQTVLDKSNIKLEEFAQQYASPSAVASLKFDAGETPLIRYNDTPNTADDVNMLSSYFSIINEITGVFGAMRGAETNASTPASLYAQQAMQGNNNIADQQSWYIGLLNKRNTKIMQLIQQYYEGKRYINITGQDYSEESKWFDADKVRNVTFDLSMSQTAQTAVFRQQNENLLFQLLQQQAIDIKTFLESSSAPFADKLLEKIKQKEEEQQEQLEQLQQLQQMQQSEQQPQPTPQPQNQQGYE